MRHDILYRMFMFPLFLSAFVFTRGVWHQYWECYISYLFRSSSAYLLRLRHQRVCHITLLGEFTMVSQPFMLILVNWYVFHFIFEVIFHFNLFRSSFFFLSYLRSSSICFEAVFLVFQNKLRLSSFFFRSSSI
jgi:hypothetical protein